MHAHGMTEVSCLHILCSVKTCSVEVTRTSRSCQLLGIPFVNILIQLTDLLTCCVALSSGRLSLDIVTCYCVR